MTVTAAICAILAASVAGALAMAIVGSRSRRTFARDFVASAVRKVYGDVPDDFIDRLFANNPEWTLQQEIARLELEAAQVVPDGVEWNEGRGHFEEEVCLGCGTPTRLRDCGWSGRNRETEVDAMTMPDNHHDERGVPIATHSYISTACHHNKHELCGRVCEFCEAVCVCPCNHVVTVPAPDERAWMRAAAERATNQLASEGMLYNRSTLGSGPSYAVEIVIGAIRGAWKDPHGAKGDA